jgi:hypothetical protein
MFIFGLIKNKAYTIAVVRERVLLIASKKKVLQKHPTHYLQERVGKAHGYGLDDRRFGV